AELTAQVLSDLGCDALLFRHPRSTPQLSYAVRHFSAQAGINITASHNPPAYNGYKVYFEDGGQIVEPHASNIIARVNSIAGEIHHPVPDSERGHILPIGDDFDKLYQQRLLELLIEPNAIQDPHRLKVVFTPLHGVGSAIIPPLLRQIGINLSIVELQARPDGNFSTVASPNPEEKSALSMAIAQAEAEKADLVIATDPDADRMGAAVRDNSGRLRILNGNQIGSILAWHRISRLFDLGILNSYNRSRAVLIKTYVTTELQKAIADHFGIRCVETLTGFKYIGAKMAKFENALPEKIRLHYPNLPLEQARQTMLEHSTYFVFGGEESYGYSGGDFVRDKDANAAALMLVEAALFAQRNGITLIELLDEIYLRFGFYLERGESLTLEGADGARKISHLLSSYRNNPPRSLAGRSLTSFVDFAKEDIRDSEGDLIPKEPMLFLTLQGHYRVAIRPSGTEPKIKYYLFGYEKPKFPQQLEETRTRVAQELDKLWNHLREDAEARVA
ncbi:MAG: phospho-sugar mutase, partial [Chthoniobacterales bacterium]|nr:phospho-sugar mutase [Chthoniobacterales bacterium]